MENRLIQLNKIIDLLISKHEVFTKEEELEILNAINSSNKKKDWHLVPKLLTVTLFLFFILGVYMVYENYLVQEKPASITKKEEKKPYSKKTLTIDFVKNNLEIGMSKKEVNELLGSDYKETIGAMDGKIFWRYDVGTKSGYHYAPDDGMDDMIDIEGLKGKSVDAIISVFWNNTFEVRTFAIYYLRESQKVIEYRVFPNGTIRETQLK
jgi:hypothetical protein